jgi:MFS family permease
MLVPEPVSGSNEYLIRGYTGRMLALLSAGLAVARVGRRALPPLLPTIIDDLSITPFYAGVALSAASATFALLQFPSGRISDQLNRKTVILTSFSILITGSILLSVSITFGLLLLGAAVIGTGEGLYGAADRGLLSDLFVEKRGVVFGLHTMFSDIGGIFASGLAAGALALGVWRIAFLPPVAGLAILALLLYRIGREPIKVEPVALQAQETVGRLFGGHRFQLMLVAYCLFAVTTQGFIGFLPALLQADQGFSPGLASLAFAGMFATGIIARPLAGRLSDIGNRLVVAGSGLIVGAVGILMLLTATAPIAAVGGIIIFAAGQKAFPPTMQAYLMDAFPEESMAGDLGATRTVYIGVGSLGPVYVGYVAGHLTYTAAFTGFIAAFLMGGFLVLTLIVTE